jgi:hypothetical protein
VWQDDVRAAADGFLRVSRAHPWAAALFGSRPAVDPKAVVGVEFLLAALTRASFPGPALDPVLADHLRAMTEWRPDDRYSFGLACVVAGLESLVSAART